MLEITRVVCGAYQENCYIINGEIIVDPGDNLPAIRAAVKNPRAILLTHGHFDHTLAAEALQAEFGIDAYIHDADAGYVNDPILSMYDETVVSLPALSNLRCRTLADSFEHFRVIHTPGHTPGSVCFYDADEGVLFTGDTLFEGAFGRTDLAGGSMSKLIASVRALFRLPPETAVYPGHAGATTIGAERGRYGW